MDDRDTVGGLRAWARGMYATEAAVELLVRAFSGRFASAGQPWIRHRPGGYWLDADALAQHTSSLSGGEQRVLAVVAALLSDQPLPDLAGILAGVDRGNLTLILAALSHAAGAHEHSEVRWDGPTAVYYRPGPILAWPDSAA
jgi:hypothetical protein